MFYANSNCAFKIIGVFFVERSCAKKISETNRNHTSIAYRISGESQLKFAANTLIAPTGSVTYIPPYTHYERSSMPETLIVLHLQGFENIGNTIEIVENAESVEPLFRKLLSAWETKDAGAYNRSIQILYNIFESLQSVTNKQSSSVPDIIKPGIELLQKRYKDSSLRIADLAAACFISEVYFRNIFHEHFGESPQKALISLRFNYVCELLCSGYYTQKEAARLAGFSDVKYFRTALKKRFGITPCEYTKKNINVQNNPTQYQIAPAE